MAEAATGPAPCTPGGPGLDLVGLCVNVDPVFDLGAHVLVLLILPFFLLALSGDKWRARVRLWLYGGIWGEAYAALLGAMLERLDRWFGPPLSWRALEQTFVVVSCMLLAVAAGAVIWSEPPDGSARESALGTTFWIVWAAALSAAFAVMRRLRARIGSARDGAPRHERRRSQLREALLSATLITAIFAAYTVSIAFHHGEATRMVVGALEGALAGAVMGAFLVAFFCFAAYWLLIASLGAIGTYSGYFEVINEENTVAMSLYVFLIAMTYSSVIFAPIAASAPFGWLSLAGGRLAIRRIRSVAGRYDAAAALGFLATFLISAVVLCCLVVTMANVAHLMHGGDRFWRELATSRNAAFEGYGLSATLMLASTLVPVAIHLFFAIFALAVLRLPFRARAAFALQEDQEGGERATQALVALYLTACAGFAMLVLWGAGRLALMGLDKLSEHGFWALIFETADRFVFVGPIVSLN